MEWIKIGGEEVKSIKYREDWLQTQKYIYKEQEQHRVALKALKEIPRKQEPWEWRRKKSIRKRVNEQGKVTKKESISKYLGSTIRDHVDCGKEINIRIAQAKAAFGWMRKMKKILNEYESKAMINNLLCVVNVTVWRWNVDNEGRHGKHKGSSGDAHTEKNDEDSLHSYNYKWSIDWSRS